MSRPMSRRPLILLAAFAVAVLFLPLPFVPAAQGQSEKAEELYQQGKKLFDEKKSSEAEPLLLKAAKQGHADAQYLLGQSKAGKNKKSRKSSRKWYGKAAASYKKLIKKGEIRGRDLIRTQERLALMYQNGYGVKKNPVKHRHWEEEFIKSYLDLAEQGDAEAQYKVGLWYFQGRDHVKQDYTKAADLFEKAAEQGNTIVLAKLGEMYENGKGVQQDYEKAIVWYEKAVESGERDAQYHLGGLYEKSQGTKKGYEKAIALYRKMAESGDWRGQYRLGRLYEEGKGTKKNYAKAFEWYSKALKSKKENNSEIHYDLGRLYEQGKGVKQDEAKSITHYLASDNRDGKEVLKKILNKKGKSFSMSQSDYATGTHVDISVEKLLRLKNGRFIAISVSVNGKKVGVLSKTFRNMEDMLKFAVNR